MAEVHIWRTLTGVVALTPDAFGFSFCAGQTEIAKFRADLEAGVPMAKAVGFSGSHCSFDSLHHVESRPGSPTVFVVARDFMGKSKEDFTFRHQPDREAFFETFARLLGPGWRIQDEGRGGWVLLIAPALVFLLSAFCLMCSGLVAVTPRKEGPRDPNATGPPLPDWVPWVMVAVSFIAAALCVYWFLKTRGGGGTKWEVICKKR